MRFIPFTRSIILLTSLFLVTNGSAFAITVADAVEASSNNDKEAVKMWSQLANKGNAIAEYNLASHYSQGVGVIKNAGTSTQWLKKATRSGLVQAYTNLNSKAVTSANGMQLTFYSGPLNWLKEQDPSQYTIQLASSRKEKSIEKIYDENFLNNKGGYYHYKRNGVDRYALIYGTYNTVAEAKAAISLLPAKLRKTTPWVRKINSIQKISQ